MLDVSICFIRIRIRDAEAAGSNPVASTLGRGTGNRLDKGFPVLFCFRRWQ